MKHIEQAMYTIDVSAPTSHIMEHTFVFYVFVLHGISRILSLFIPSRR